jgi:hypothetical protein
MILGALLERTCVNGRPTPVVNPGSCDHNKLGAEICPPLQGEHWWLNSVAPSAIGSDLSAKASAENGNGLVSAVGHI